MRTKKAMVDKLTDWRRQLRIYPEDVPRDVVSEILDDCEEAAKILQKIIGK